MTIINLLVNLISWLWNNVKDYDELENALLKKRWRRLNFKNIEHEWCIHLLKRTFFCHDSYYLSHTLFYIFYVLDGNDTESLSKMLPVNAF